MGFRILVDGCSGNSDGYEGMDDNNDTDNNNVVVGVHTSCRWDLTAKIDVVVVVHEVRGTPLTLERIETDVAELPHRPYLHPDAIGGGTCPPQGTSRARMKIVVYLCDDDASIEPDALARIVDVPPREGVVRRHLFGGAAAGRCDDGGVVVALLRIRSPVLGPGVLSRTEVLRRQADGSAGTSPGSAPDPGVPPVRQHLLPRLLGVPLRHESLDEPDIVLGHARRLRDHCRDPVALVRSSGQQPQYQRTRFDVHSDGERLKNEIVTSGSLHRPAYFGVRLFRNVQKQSIVLAQAERYIL